MGARGGGRAHGQSLGRARVCDRMRTFQGLGRQRGLAGAVREYGTESRRLTGAHTPPPTHAPSHTCPLPHAPSLPHTHALPLPHAPPQVAAAAHAASPQDDETLVAALQLFVELCEASAPLLGKHLPAVVALAMRVGTDPGTELSTREAALEVGRGVWFECGVWVGCEGMRLFCVALNLKGLHRCCVACCVVCCAD